MFSVYPVYKIRSKTPNALTVEIMSGKSIIVFVLFGFAILIFPSFILPLIFIYLCVLMFRIDLQFLKNQENIVKKYIIFSIPFKETVYHYYDINKIELEYLKEYETSNDIFVLKIVLQNNKMITIYLYKKIEKAIIFVKLLQSYVPSKYFSDYEYYLFHPNDERRNSL